jgi:hypothetical protein
MPADASAAARIVVVEDEGITAMDTGDLLQSMGYTVPAVAFSGRDAIQQVDRLRPDLVLMDIRLKGGVDGIAAAEEIQRRFRVPVVYATAYADDVTLARAKVTEPLGYLLKPFTERELRTAIETALHKHRANRQRADFLAMLSHDIRNPLHVALAYADMLADEVRGAGLLRAEDLLQRMRTTMHSVHTLVTNYLEVSRIESGQMTLARTSLHLNNVVERVRDQYDEEARRRGVRLGVVLHEPLPACVADPVAVERILTNLVYNALKFTPPDGTVTVRSAVRGREIVLEVDDSGPGIPAERLAHLFDRYQRPAPATEGGGTGLGLFIVKTLVEAHGGRITVGAPSEGGTRMTVLLPAAG